MPKFEPIRVIISKNSPLENLNKIDGEICKPISEIIKEMKTIDELKSKAMEPIVNRFLNEDVLSQTKANAELIALNEPTNEIEKYRYAVRDATEWKEEAMGELRTFRNELTASNPLKEEAERLSIALSAGELGKLKAVSGEESGIQGTINMADSNVSLTDHKIIMEKLRRATEKICPSINHLVASKGNVMGINIASKDYKYFLERIEAFGDNVGIELYKLFYNDDEVRRIILASAINDGEINFHVETGIGRVFPLNTAIVHIESDPLYAEHEAHDEKRKEIIESYLTAYNEDRYKHLKMNLMLFLETKSFLAWLKKKYPYEGEAKAEHTETAKEKISELCLADILNLITPEMYQDGLTGQEKSAITNSLNKLKAQIPKAFELCSALVMEAMPCESRKEPLKYSRDDIENRADKEGISTPMARQIHKALPAMLKK
ncbi:MAG TPA: hypothetical protein VLS94_10345 [Fusibacter sp.]|nr:hypothetical protein [Fusibacter sp.]